MRFRTDRPHEDRPLRAGHGQTGSILIAFHARPEIDVDAVMIEVEKLLREVLDDWFSSGGHELVQAAPDIA